MNGTSPAEAAGGRPDDEATRIVPLADYFRTSRTGAGSQRARRIDTGRSYEEFWPGRAVTLLAESIAGHGTTEIIPGWVCASTPALLVMRWSPARSRMLLNDVLDADDVTVPELRVGPARPCVVVWVCPVDRWRAAAAAEMTGVPGCIPWPPNQLLV